MSASSLPGLLLASLRCPPLREGVPAQCIELAFPDKGAQTSLPCFLFCHSLYHRLTNTSSGPSAPSRDCTSGVLNRHLLDDMNSFNKCNPSNVFLVGVRCPCPLTPNTRGCSQEHSSGGPEASGTRGQTGKAGPLVYFALEVVVGGGSGRGALPQLASALGVPPLQRFPVEAEDVLRGSLGCSQALLQLRGRDWSAQAHPCTGGFTWFLGPPNLPPPSSPRQPPTPILQVR